MEHNKVQSVLGIMQTNNTLGFWLPSYNLGTYTYGEIPKYNQLSLVIIHLLFFALYLEWDDWVEY